MGSMHYERYHGVENTAYSQAFGILGGIRYLCSIILLPSSTIKTSFYLDRGPFPILPISRSHQANTWPACIRLTLPELT